MGVCIAMAQWKTIAYHWFIPLCKLRGSFFLSCFFLAVQKTTRRLSLSLSGVCTGMYSKRKKVRGMSPYNAKKERKKESTKKGGSAHILYQLSTMKKKIPHPTLIHLPRKTPSEYPSIVHSLMLLFLRDIKPPTNDR